jgi:hypothetical protein
VTPKEVVDAIEVRLGLSGHPTQLRDAIERELLDKGGLSGPSAAEQTTSMLVKVTREITLRKIARDQAGEIAMLDLRKSTDTLVCGSCFVFGDDLPDVVTRKKNRVLADDVLIAIEGLTFSEFEKFGSKVLEELGTRLSRYTKHAGDQGIDFFGEITVGHLLQADQAAFKLMHQTRLVIVGQAKHYPTRTIGPNLVRELVGALSLSRTATYSNDNVDLLDEVQLRPFTPLMAMLFSTGDFTSGARKLADRAGLIVFSGEQLAVFLADKGVGIAEKNGTAAFDPVKFAAWLNF